VAEPSREQELTFPERFQGAELWQAIALAAQQLDTQRQGSAGEFAALIGTTTSRPEATMFWPAVLELRPQYEDLRLQAKWLTSEGRDAVNANRSTLLERLRTAGDPATLRGYRQALWILQQAAASPGKRRPLSAITRDLDLQIAISRPPPDTTISTSTARSSAAIADIEAQRAADTAARVAQQAALAEQKRRDSAADIASRVAQQAATAAQQRRDRDLEDERRRAQLLTRVYSGTTNAGPTQWRVVVDIPERIVRLAAFTGEPQLGPGVISIEDITFSPRAVWRFKTPARPLGSRTLVL
jgi:hypothetical protein